VFSSKVEGLYLISGFSFSTLAYRKNRKLRSNPSPTLHSSARTCTDDVSPRAARGRAGREDRQRQQLGDDVIGYAHAIRIEALARLGELLKTLEKAKNTSGLRRGPVGSSAVPTGVETLKDLGISKKVSHIAQRLAELPVAEREAIKRRESTLAQAPEAEP
jgi:hypothetical protein